MNTIKPETVVFCQRYLEADEFFGSKPDGFSLHLTENGLEKFAAPYRPLNRGDVTYTDGKPYPVLVRDLQATLVKELEQSPNDMVRVYRGKFRVPNPPADSSGIWEQTGPGSYGAK